MSTVQPSKKLVDNVNRIHPTAIIADSAVLADTVTVGPYCVIGENVTIGDNTIIHPHAVIHSNTRMGKNNVIYQFASVGGDNQDLIKDNEPTWLEIGDFNIVHEFVTINRGSIKQSCVTKVGNHNLFMAYTHIGHDCDVGNHVIFANGATLAGHVRVDDHATIGAYCAVHQFCHIGQFSFLARGVMAVQDILPYLIVTGNSPTVNGINVVGLKRYGFTSKDITLAQQAYKIIFRQDLTIETALEELAKLEDANEIVANFIHAIKRAERGIVR